MIYLDSSALMKLVREETGTPALQDWLTERPEQAMVTSELGRVEVLRAARRAGDDASSEARALVGDLDLVPLDRTVQDTACDLGGPLLHTLAALHLASALTLGDAVTAFVAYEHRLADAARGLGFVTITPGTPADDEGMGPEPS